MDGEIQHVVNFWFNRNPIEWIVAPEGFDEQCRSNFDTLVKQARHNELDAWADSPEGSLALVILLDQLPRNLHRGTVDAFASDAEAHEIAARAIARDFDKLVTVIQASAFYMALLQQESLTSVVAARALFEALQSRAASEEEQKWIEMGVAGAKGHAKQLVQFGRYPTRNAVLGRTSTKIEEEFLTGHKFQLPSKGSEV